jgi:hypothetical protein
MRATVAKVVSETNQTGSQTDLNRIGLVNENPNITCTNLTLNYSNGEYISNMAVSFSAANVTRV